MGWREKGPRKSSFQLSDWRVFGQEPSEHAAPLSPSGATAIQHYRQPLSRKLLRKVAQVELQEANGDCYLQAFV